MKSSFVIIGSGRFGTAIARELVLSGSEVMLIDRNEEIVQTMSDVVTYAIQADATDENTLKSLGIRNFETAIVAIGEDIQSSILVTIILKELGVKNIIAKAINDLHAKVLKRVGADEVVFPERDMGTKIAHKLISPNIFDYIELSKEFSIVELPAPSSWVNRTLIEINPRKNNGVNIIAFRNAKNNKIDLKFTADTLVKQDDYFYVIGTNDDIVRLSDSK
jgi:trk system potassium uptake protein TrkA